MQKLTLTFVLSLSLLAISSAFTPPPLDITNNEVTLNFPESATFHITLTGKAEITSVVLEYGDRQQTCGEVVAKAFPQFTPGKTTDVDWIWEMRQSGSLPPGAQLWWRWRVTDANGNETLTETKTATWLDEVHPWQTMNEGDFIRLHWYDGDKTFATELAQAAAGGLQFNETQSGLKADAPIDLYIYANTNDLKEAVLYEASWIGGEAFPDQNIVIIGISESDLEWGKDAIVHELTHVLVGHLTFSCLGDVPTWLNEGLAVYSEGKLDSDSQWQLDDAIQNNTLLTVRSLSGGFSEVADKANLSYSESYSVTKFLIDTYGQDKMTSLLVGLRDGLTIDEALTQTYGFNVEGLEDAWRKAIDAQPRMVSAQPTAQPTPTFVPTFIPVGAVPFAAQITATPVPTSSFGGQPTPTPTRVAPPLSLTLLLLTVCCFLILILGVLILGLVLRNQNSQGGKNVQ
jgi:hypothetical protein